MSELSQKPKANNAPTYMCLYPGLAEIARANGYALAVHGSLARDMDLIAVPWIDNPSSPEAVIAAIESDYGIRRIGDLTAAPHGRMVQTIGIQFGECFIDLSFMPSSGRNFNAGTASDAQPSGDHMESGEFNDPLYNAESDARNAAALLEEVLEWFDDGVGRSPEEFRLMRRIGDWLGRSVAEIKDSSDECAHSEANKIGCPECGEREAMTTNQTIDGVPRELLEHLVDPVNHIGRVKARAELRALLDAPAVERKPFGWFRTPKDCPLQGMFLHYDPEHGERDIQNALDFGFTVKRLYDTPAAQPQGEPVAWMRAESPGMCISDEVKTHNSKIGGAPAKGVEMYTVPLYAEQPAPVAVVLPERKENHDSGPTLRKIQADGWNACLDELDRLNPCL